MDLYIVWLSIEYVSPFNYVMVIYDIGCEVYFIRLWTGKYYPSPQAESYIHTA